MRAFKSGPVRATAKAHYFRLLAKQWESLVALIYGMCSNSGILSMVKLDVKTTVLVFKGPVQSSFFAPFGRTATATGCLLW
jgi:hypothetical protein